MDGFEFNENDLKEFTFYFPIKECSLLFVIRFCLIVICYQIKQHLLFSLILPLDLVHLQDVPALTLNPMFFWFHLLQFQK